MPILANGVDEHVLQADPAGGGGIIAYGEHAAGAIPGDKTIGCRVNIPDAAFQKFWEVANMRITCTPSGASNWKPGAYVVTSDGDAVILGDDLDFDTWYDLKATYEQATGTLTLYVDDVEVNTTTFGEERDTLTGLPIWQVGAPAGGMVGRCALWSEALTIIAPPPPALFTDDFNRADTTLTNSPALGLGWACTPFTATAGILSNTAKLSGSFGCWCLAPTSGIVDTADHWSKADIVAGLPGDIAGVFVRLTDQNDFYIGRCNQIGSDTYELYKRVGGTYTLLDSQVESFPSLPFKIKLEVNGTSLIFSVWDGSTWVPKCTATDSSHTTGSVGIFWQEVAGPGQFDNYEAGDT